MILKYYFIFTSCPFQIHTTGLQCKQVFFGFYIQRFLHSGDIYFQDFSLNLEESKDLTRQFNPELIIIESGGDNLAANFSRELADYIIYVIDVAGT